jgi:predicted phage-related endonuclease
MNYKQYKELESLKADAFKKAKTSKAYKEYEEALNQFKIAENWKKEQLEMVELGKVNSFVGEDFKVVMNITTTKEFSTEKLRNEFPDIYEQCFVDVDKITKRMVKNDRD